MPPTTISTSATWPPTRPAARSTRTTIPLPTRPSFSFSLGLGLGLRLGAGKILLQLVGSGIVVLVDLAAGLMQC
jgi:hypothetical protein